MGYRIMTNTGEVISASRKAMIEGIIQGKGLGAIIAGIVNAAVEFGRNAEKITLQRPRFITIDELNEECVEYAVENLFTKNGLGVTVRYIVEYAISYGYHATNDLKKYESIYLLLASMENEQQASGDRATDDTMDAFFGEMVKIMDNKEYEQARKFMDEIRKRKIKTKTVPNSTKFIRMFAQLIGG